MGLVQKGTPVVFYIRMPRETERHQRKERDFRHPLVCRDYKSGNRYIHGNNCLYRHPDDEEKPSKRSKSESTQGAVAILKEKKVQGCVSQNSNPKKSTLRKAGQTRLNASAGHVVKFCGRHLVRSSISVKKRAISRRYPKR